VILHALRGWGEQKDLESSDSDPQLAQKMHDPTEKCLTLGHAREIFHNGPHPFCLSLYFKIYVSLLGVTGLSQVVPLDFSVNPAYFSNGLLGVLLPEG